jgi:hypothetical protein
MQLGDVGDAQSIRITDAGVSMSLPMQVRSGEPKLFDSGNAWGDDSEGAAANGSRQTVVQCRAFKHDLMLLLRASMAPWMCSAIE